MDNINLTPSLSFYSQTEDPKLSEQDTITGSRFQKKTISNL